MNHVDDLLSEYLDNRLSPEARRSVDTHLTSCDRCKAHYADLQKVRGLIKAGPTLTPPESMYRNVMRQVSEPTPSSWIWGIPMKLAASACVVLLVVLIARRDIPQKTAVSLDKLSSLENESRPAPKSIVSYGLSKKKNDRPEAFALDDEAPQRLKEEVQDNVQTRGVRAGERPMLQAKSGSAPAPASEPVPLKDRKDVYEQARDMGGVASQSSFRQIMREARRTPQAVEGAAAVTNVRAPSALFPVVIRSRPEWQTLWSTREMDSSAPAIDFSKFWVVGLFLGPESTGAVTITRLEETPSALVVHYHRPVAANKQLYDYRTIPITQRPIVFQEDR